MVATAIALGKPMAAMALASTAFTHRTSTRWHATTEQNFEELDEWCVAMTATPGLKTTTGPPRNNQESPIKLNSSTRQTA